MSDDFIAASPAVQFSQQLENIPGVQGVVSRVWCPWICSYRSSTICVPVAGTGDTWVLKKGSGDTATVPNPLGAEHPWQLLGWDVFLGNRISS